MEVNRLEYQPRRVLPVMRKTPFFIAGGLLAAVLVSMMIVSGVRDHRAKAAEAARIQKMSEETQKVIHDNEVMSRLGARRFRLMAREYRGELTDSEREELRLLNEMNARDRIEAIKRGK